MSQPTPNHQPCSIIPSGKDYLVDSADPEVAQALIIDDPRALKRRVSLGVTASRGLGVEGRGRLYRVEPEVAEIALRLKEQIAQEGGELDG